MGLKEFTQKAGGIIGNAYANVFNLKAERAFAVPNSNRSIWSNNLINGLTTERLAQILKDVRAGEMPNVYLEIAQELE